MRPLDATPVCAIRSAVQGSMRGLAKGYRLSTWQSLLLSRLLVPTLLSRPLVPNSRSVKQWSCSCPAMLLLRLVAAGLAAGCGALDCHTRGVRGGLCKHEVALHHQPSINRSPARDSMLVHWQLTRTFLSAAAQHMSCCACRGAVLMCVHSASFKPSLAQSGFYSVL